VRENRTHGSMRRREATNVSRLARATEEPSRRPYDGAVSVSLPLATESGSSCQAEQSARLAESRTTACNQSAAPALR
jgi:hypothetical protein